MKKLMFGVACVVIVFAGYGVAIETGSAARGHGGGLHTGTKRSPPAAPIPARSDRSEDEFSAADTEILLVGTLIALAIAGEALPFRNHCATAFTASDPEGRSRPPAHKLPAPC